MLLSKELTHSPTEETEDFIHDVCFTLVESQQLATKILKTTVKQKISKSKGNGIAVEEWLNDKIYYRNTKESEETI